MVQRPRREGWLVLSGLVCAGLALPQAPGSWNAPDFAAILAVSAIALLAGQRWAVAAVVIAELCLVPTIWPRVLESGWISRLIALATLAVIIPGVRAIPRAAAVLVSMTGRANSEHMCRRTRLALLAFGALTVIVPLL